MADNYLENKFEEYQKRKSSKSATLYHRNNIIHHTKRVFITGGARGIGRAIVKEFRRAGHRVAFCDIDDTKGKETAITTGTTFMHADVGDREQLEKCMQQLFEQWGDIDILINNAGITEFSPITSTSVEDFDRILAINLRSAFITARQLALHRKKLEKPNHFGRIVNICSTRYQMSEAGTEGYSASKGGIYSLSHALCISLSDLHITVNSISPGWIQNNNYESLSEKDHLQHPSQRVGQPEDIARMCLFICREENDFINGENITIDGGMTKKMIYQE